jgi:hypothetical protein
MAGIKLPPLPIGRLLQPFASSPQRYKRSLEPWPFHPQHFAPSSSAYPCPEPPNTKHRRRVPFPSDASFIPLTSRQLPPLVRFPIIVSVFCPARGEVFPARVAARLDSDEPTATTARGPRCARRPPSRSGSRDHELGLWYFLVEK